MEDVLELVDRRQSACFWNLPSRFTKDHLKTYLEQGGFPVKNIVVLHEKGCAQAVVVLPSSEDVERLVKDEHEVDGTQLRVTPAPFNESPVFKSVDAVVNSAWVHNKKMEEVLDAMNGVEIERKKDGVHLVASLQKIVQAERQLKNALTAKNLDKIRVSSDVWRYIEQYKRKELRHVEDTNSCRFVAKFEGDKCWLEAVMTRGASPNDSGLGAIAKLCSSLEKETEQRCVPLNSLPADVMKERLRDIKLDCLVNVSQEDVLLFSRRENIRNAEEEILKIIQKATDVRPKDTNTLSPGRNEKSGVDKKDEKITRQGGDNKSRAETTIDHGDDWEKGLFNGNRSLAWDSVDTKDNAKNSTKVSPHNGWEDVPKERPANAKLVLKMPALPQRESREPRRKREVYRMGNPKENQQLMDLTDLDLQLINQILDDDLNSFGSPTAAKLFEEPTAAKLLEEPTAAKLLEEPTAAKLFEEPTAAKLFEEPTAAKLFEEPTAAKPFEKNVAAKTFEKPTATKPIDDPTEPKSFENLTADKSIENLTAAKPVEYMYNTAAFSDEELDALNPSTEKCLRLCDLCFAKEPSLFRCTCDFEVCCKCKENSTCPKCGKSFDDIPNEENLANNQQGTLFLMRQSKMPMPGSASAVPLRLRVVPKDSSIKEKIFWLPDSVEGKEVSNMMTELTQKGKLFTVDQATITLNVEVKNLFGAHGYPDSTYISRVKDQVKKLLQHA